MLQIKKTKDHAESDVEEEENEEIDFAWLLYMGMQFGYSEKEVSRLYFGKWLDLFEVHKIQHNFKVKRFLYTDRKERVSLLNL